MNRKLRNLLLVPALAALSTAALGAATPGLSYAADAPTYTVTVYAADGQASAIRQVSGASSMGAAVPELFPIPPIPSTTLSPYTEELGCVPVSAGKTVCAWETIASILFPDGEPEPVLCFDYNGQRYCVHQDT